MYYESVTIVRDFYIYMMCIVKNDDVTNATRCSLWFKMEVISCEVWVIMAISNELMVE